MGLSSNMSKSTGQAEGGFRVLHQLTPPSLLLPLPLPLTSSTFRQWRRKGRRRNGCALRILLMLGMDDQEDSANDKEGREDEEDLEEREENGKMSLRKNRPRSQRGKNMDEYKSD